MNPIFYVNKSILKNALIFLAIAIHAQAHAVSLDVGGNDLSVRWDNTIRYNLGVRVEERGKVGNNPAFDEGEYRFDQGDIVTNRLDLLSQFDLVWKRRYGARISAIGWYDDAYEDRRAHRNPDLPNSIEGSYEDDRYSNYTKRFYTGPSGEILDAFVFGTHRFQDKQISARLGQHTVFWGESLFTPVHGVNYGQAPLDLAKAFATPGVEAREIFRPLNQISTQLIVSPTLSFSGQYFFDWDKSTIPEGGTFLGPSDPLLYGADRINSNIVNGGVISPETTGDWGVSARWSPSWVGGTLGFYYRNVTDKIPQIYVTPSGEAVPSAYYNQYFAEDIDIAGLSLTKQVGGASVGAEVSYRWDMPLESQILGAVASDAELIGNSYAARGNTIHALVNAIGVTPRTPLFDTSSWAVELTYVRLDQINDNESMFYGVGYGVCESQRDKWDGCAEDESFALSLKYTPKWLQVFPGVDMEMPISYSRTLKGNAPIKLGGNEKNGGYSVGLDFDVRSQYRIGFKYVDYYGESKESEGLVPGTTQISSVNGLTTLLKDRGFFAMTLSTTY